MAKSHSLAVLCVLLVCVTAQYVSVSPMPKGGRSDTSAVVVGDQIIIAGGCNAQTCSNDACLCSSVVATVEAYHPETDQWTELPSMPAPRCRHGAVSINNKVYIVGGRDVDDVVQETVFVFDVATQTWSNLTQTWPSATSDLVVVAYDSFIYAIGGYTPGYDPVNQICNFDTQQPSSSWYCTSSLVLNKGRGDACGAVLDGIVYIFGGFSDYEWCLPQNSVEAFNPVTNTVVELPKLDKPRGDSACAVVHNEFHAIGGQIKDSECLYDVPIYDVEHYDPIKEDWVEETPLPAPRFRFSGTSYNNIIYVFGGQASFEPATQTFPVLDSVLKWQDADATSTASSFLTSTTALLIALMMALF